MDASTAVIDVVLTSITVAIGILWKSYIDLNAVILASERKCEGKCDFLQLDYLKCEVSVARLEARILALEDQIKSGEK